MTDLEKANDLLREVIAWGDDRETRTLSAITTDARAYLATQPEPVDPDLLAAREIYKPVKLGWNNEDIDAGQADNAPFIRAILAGIKHGRGA